MLTSSQNEKVKYFSSLKSNKPRRTAGKFLVEGVHLVREAMQAGLLEKVIYSEKILETSEGRDLLGKLISAGIPNEEANEKVIQDLSEVETPQGIIAAVRPKISDLGSLFEKNDPLIVVACGVQDPGNLGTIIRTADAAGCSGIILTKGTVNPYNSKVIRSSSGSIFHLNIVKIDDIIDLASALKRRGIRMISTVVDAAKEYYSVDYSGPVAVVIGSESKGISSEVERLSDESVSIPMLGGVESLNAAVSCAVILYEALRQRRTSAG
ncbi:MAG: 23S rRNA (guanosine(2251)-2'-O)-methyltransferase RlmB [bacterium]